MTEEQLKNIIHFSVLISSVRLKELSPDYIKEKWNKYIGTEPKLDSNFYIKIKEWSDIWGKHTDVFSIISLIIELREYIFNCEKIRLSKIVKIFEKYIDVNKVNFTFYNNLHANLVSSIKNWLEQKENKRDYNLITILS